jgi:hypothetical protein
MELVATLDALVAVLSLRSRPIKRPDKLYADKDCDFERFRRYLKRLGIRARITNKGVESSESLGRNR